MKSFNLNINSPELQILSNIVKERLIIRGITENENPELLLNVILDPSAEKDTFRITGSNSNITITADSLINCFAGVGSFLHNSRYNENGIEPSLKRGITKPDCEIRCVYLANHFHNFFHNAPIEKIKTYIEDMALMGFNTLNMAAPSINLKKSDKANIEKENQRLYSFFNIGKSLGMKLMTFVQTSQTYEDFPKELEFTKHDANNNSGNVMCISKKGALDIIISENKEYLEGIKNNGLTVDYLMTWPYDEGGCNCEKCRPWGRNGYVRAAKVVTQKAKEIFPDAKIICSTWTFDYNPEFANNPEKSEWVGFAESLNDDKWADIILADAHEEFPKYPLEKGVPGDLPIISFPEISMWGLYPWGGYGANPLPKRITKVWRETEGILRGESLYSEGIYEDLNKYIISGLCEDFNRNPDEMLANYSSYYFGCTETKKFIKLIELIEYNHWLTSELVDIDHVPQDIIVARKNLKARMGDNNSDIFCDLEASKVAYKIACEIDSILPEWGKNSWRWRIIYIRALLDYHRYSGVNISENETTLSAMHELIDIFHCLKRNTVNDIFHERVRPSCPEYD